MSVSGYVENTGVGKDYSFLDFNKMNIDALHAGISKHDAHLIIHYKNNEVNELVRIPPLDGKLEDTVKGLVATFD